MVYLWGPALILGANVAIIIIRGAWHKLDHVTESHGPISGDANVTSNDSQLVTLGPVDHAPNCPGKG